MVFFSNHGPIPDADGISPKAELITDGFESGIFSCCFFSPSYFAKIIKGMSQQIQQNDQLFRSSPRGGRNFSMDQPPGLLLAHRFRPGGGRPILVPGMPKGRFIAGAVEMDLSGLMKHFLGKELLD